MNICKIYVTMICCGPQLTTLLHDRLWIGLDWLPEVGRWLLNEYMQDLQWFAVDQQLIMGPFRPEDLPVESLRISPLNAEIKPNSRKYLLTNDNFSIVLCFQITNSRACLEMNKLIQCLEMTNHWQCPSYMEALN